MKKKKNKEENKDNNIKKPLSAYMLYNNHRRPVLRKEYPRKSNPFQHIIELTLPEVSRLIGDEWNKLSSE